MDEAARIIRDDPRRAAQIYLTHEPSKALDAAEVDAVLRDNKDEFGSAVEGIQAFADFLSPPRRTENAAEELEGYRRPGAVEFAEHVVTTLMVIQPALAGRWRLSLTLAQPNARIRRKS